MQYLIHVALWLLNSMNRGDAAIARSDGVLHNICLIKLIFNHILIINLPIPLLILWIPPHHLTTPFLPHSRHHPTLPLFPQLHHLRLRHLKRILHQVLRIHNLRRFQSPLLSD